MADRIQLRRDTKANWESYNPILLEGEPGHVLDDPNLYKMGDGIHAWNDLPYRGYDGTVLQEVQQGIDDAVPSSSAVYDFKDIFVQLSKNISVDLCFIDRNLNCLVYFKDGHVVTKNFDSRNISANLSFNVVTADNDIDFSVDDKNGNIVLAIKNGELFTKEFSSKYAAVCMKSDIKGDLALTDGKGNVLLVIKNGEIITNNFRSDDIKIIESVYDADLSFQDKNGNVGLLVRNGFIFSKNFNSRKLSQDLAFLINKINNRYFDINDWSGKNICILGDSIIDQGYVTSYIAEELKCNIYNRGWSGAMVTPTKYLQGSESGVTLDNKAYAYTNRCDYADDNDPENHHGAMPSADLIDLIILHGGGNDCSHGDGDGGARTQIAFGSIGDAMSNTLVDPDSQETGASFYAALKYTCYKLRQKYPNIPFAICNLYVSYAYQNTNTADYLVNPNMSVTPIVKPAYADGVKKRSDFNNALYEVARQFGAYIIDLNGIGMPDYTQEMAEKYYNDGDMTHPSHVIGASVYGKAIARQIRDNIIYMDKNAI